MNISQDYSTAAHLLAFESLNLEMGIPYLGISDEEQFDILLVKYPILISAWLILAIAPRWKYTVAIASHVALFYGLVYVAILADSMFLNPVPMETPDWTSPSLVAKLCAPGESKCVVGPDKIMELFMSLDGVHLLFSTKGACFGGWVHYCVFDLLAGTYIVRNNSSLFLKVA